MSLPEPVRRPLGVLGAGALGVGAMVGGGIFVLTGVALGVAGPSVLLAFALNGLIAALSALSFAEMAAAYPQSGGAYVFAKRVLSVRVAFLVGWTLLFASVAASVLYALGFASFALFALHAFRPLPDEFPSRGVAVLLGLAATGVYTYGLLRRAGGGGAWATYGRLAALAVLVAGGLAAIAGAPVLDWRERLTPFFAGGAGGLVAAMGFTFIAFQGFHFVAVFAGEVREPARTLPRAMLATIAVALLIYLPLVLVIAGVGVLPGESLTALGRAHPETVVAVAAERFLGAFGFWLVVAAALLSTLSALQANLLAASRIALIMARDRTLPRNLARLTGQGVPRVAVLASALLVGLLLVLLPDVAAAGAAASLIFLVSFALVHGLSMLERRRIEGASLPFRTPLYPLVPLLGLSACAGLAAFQGLTVPVAGVITLLWLLLGFAIYVGFLARRARTLDALAEARDPDLLKLRGKYPVALVPIANPANAASMVQLASALTPDGAGRVLLLSVVSGGKAALQNAQAVLSASLGAALEVGVRPEALTTLADDPWAEIARVARSYGCASLLLGLSDLTRADTRVQLERLLREVHSDVAVLRIPPGWQLAGARRILVPVGGRSHHDVLRARLLGSLARGAAREVRYLRVLPEAATAASAARAGRALLKIAEDERGGDAATEVLRSDEPLTVLERAAEAADLLILGVRREGRDRALGDFALELTRRTRCAVIMLSHEG